MKHKRIQVTFTFDVKHDTAVSLTRARFEMREALDGYGLIRAGDNGCCSLKTVGKGQIGEITELRDVK